MSHIGVRELKAQLSQQLKRVQRGTRLTITDRGRPIAVLSPVEPQANVALRSAATAAARVSVLVSSLVALARLVGSSIPTEGLRCAI